MKKVSHTGAKLQIQNNPPGVGARLAGVLELESSRPAAGAVPGRAAATALQRTRGSQFGKALKSVLTSIPIQNCI